MIHLATIRPISKQGFSLIELLVAVSILGILAGFSTVAFSRNWRDERLKAASRETTAWLDEVRRLAIQKAMPCRIAINPTAVSLSLNPSTTSATEFCGEQLIAPLPLRSKVTNAKELSLCSGDIQTADPANAELNCNASQGSASSLIFTPRGTATSGLLLKLHLPQASSDRCIAVLAPLGQIRSGKATAAGCDFTTAY